jgi:hypothetical protein
MSKRVVVICSLEGIKELVSAAVRELPAEGEVKFQSWGTTKMLRILVREEGDNRPFKLDVE